MASKFKILTCDGGGIRGLLTTVILERLEQKLGSPLNQHFDMFAGTSTGSIIACAIAKGMSTTALRQFYKHKGINIFPNMDFKFWMEKLGERAKALDPSLPLFKNEGLEVVLQDPNIFDRDFLFGKLPATLVVSYDVYNRSAVVFKSNHPDFAQIPVWEVCCCSSAAPVAFAGHFLTNPTYLSSLEQKVRNPNVRNPVPIEIPTDKHGVKGLPLIDGGVVANNPVLCAIAESLKMGKSNPDKYPQSLDDIVVASFGTGQMLRRITIDEAEHWGALDWTNLAQGLPILDTFADGSSDLIDYIASQLLDDRYNRYQPLVPSNISTFQANPENLTRLVNAANDFLDSKGGDSQLDALVSAIHS